MSFAPAAFDTPTLARTLIGLVLAIAGGAKLIHPQTTRRVIATGGLVPKVMVRWVAIGLPPLELSVGVLLIAGLWIRPASAAAAAMFACFATAVAIRQRRGERPTACGCFGNSTLITRSLAVRNGGLACIALAGTDLNRRPIYLALCGGLLMIAAALLDKFDGASGPSHGERL